MACPMACCWRILTVTLSSIAAAAAAVAVCPVGAGAPPALAALVAGEEPRELPPIEPLRVSRARCDAERALRAPPPRSSWSGGGGWGLIG